MTTVRRLRSIEGGARPEDRLVDVHAVVDDYLKPAVEGLEEAVDAGDLAAVRVYSHELIAVAGSLIAACPRPRPNAPR